MEPTSPNQSPPPPSSPQTPVANAESSPVPSPVPAPTPIPSEPTPPVTPAPVLAKSHKKMLIIGGILMLVLGLIGGYLVFS